MFSSVTGSLPGPPCTPHERLDNCAAAYGDRPFVITGTGPRGRPEWVYYGRYERRLTIAHPDHRAALAAELEEHVLNGAVT